MANPPIFNLRQEDIPNIEGIDKLVVALGKFAQQTQLAFQNSITFTENVKCQLAEIDVTLNTETFILSLISPWHLHEVSGASSYFGPPIIRKADNGLVIIHGLIAGGNSDTVAIQIAQTYRPKNRVIGVSYGKFSDYEAAYRWEILPTGELKIGTGVKNSTQCEFFHLHASWLAEDTTPLVNSIFPYKIKLNLPANTVPVGVWVMKALEITSDAKDERPVGSPLFVDWDTDQSYLVVRNIPGLIPEKRYKIRLLILGG